MKRILTALIGLWMAGTVAAKELTLVTNGQPQCVIIVPKQKACVAWFSAGELQNHIRQITGAEIPVITDADPVPSNAVVKILVGESGATKTLGLTTKDFKLQEFLVKFSENDVVLMGRDENFKPAIGEQYDEFQPEALKVTIDQQNGRCATSYAVYEFLEKRCGVRWLHPGELGTCLTPRKTLTVEASDIHRSPSIRWRTMPWGGNMGMWPAHDGRDELLFKLRNKAGGEGLPSGHAFNGYPARFGKTPDPQHPEVWEGYKPELFAKYKDPTKPTGQLCFSSPALIEQVMKDADDWFTKGIVHYRSELGPDYISVMCPDAFCDCECEECTKVRQPRAANGDIYAMNSQKVWEFTDKIARLVAAKYPGKFVSQCAYLDYTAYPEGLTLATNILIGPAMATRSSWVDPNSVERKMYDKWRAKCPGQMGSMWTYPCFPAEYAEGMGYKCFPGYMAHKTAEFTKMFVNDGMRGIMNCGQGELIDTYVILKTMDDATLDVDALLNDTFKAYYGAAAEPMRQMYLDIENTYWDINNYPGHAWSCAEDVCWDHLATQERMDRWQGYVDEAKKLATTPVEKQRLAIFENGVWTHMTTGFKKYQFHKQYAKEVAELRAAEPRKATAARLTKPVADGNPQSVDWTGIETLKINRSSYGWPAMANTADLRLAHDGTYLYIAIDDHCDGNTLSASHDWFGGERWEAFFGAKRGKKNEENPYRQIALRPFGSGEVDYWQSEKDDTFVNSHCIQFKQTRDASGWNLRASIPIAQLAMEGDVKPGGTFYFNLVRPTYEGKDILVFTLLTEPGHYHDMPRAAEITLEK